MAKPRIRLARNGPIVVEGLDTFRDGDGSPLETHERMRLCRCGGSATKPYCDGTHARIGFDDSKSAELLPDRREDYAGPEVTIHDNRAICSHAGYCTEGLPAVWRTGVEPWIEPGGADGESIVEVVKMCPSGALSFSIGGVESRDRERPPAIHLSPDGPYLVTGGVELDGVEWLEGASREHYTLCRCGASSNKPFCDGSHWYVDFTHGAGTKMFAAEATNWYRVIDPADVADGEVVTAQAGTTPVAVARIGDTLSVLDNRCPHQGGPLGEGLIEDGCLRCPWHGWAFDPITGVSVDDHADRVKAYRSEHRADGLYAAVLEPTKHIRTVSDLMVETMINWGVTHVFGMVGHSNLGLADAFRLFEESGDLTFVGIRHEGAASFAASAFAKLTGRPAACFGIAGPGSTNLLTGLWDAKMDRAPILALCGQVNTQVFGPGAFQEIDLASAFAPVSAFSQTVLPNSDHAELMALALKTAIVERNVGNLIFPDEVQNIPAKEHARASRPDGRLSATTIAPPLEAIADAAVRIRDAEYPVIIVGYGARDSMPAIVALAEHLTAPVVTTFKAKGQISDLHPLAGGVLGRSGTPIASYLMERADLLVVFGASFSNHTGIDDLKDIIQVDYDRMALGKFHPVTVPVWGDAAVAAAALRDSVPSDHECRDQTSDIAHRWDLWRAEKTKRAAKRSQKGLNSASVFSALSEAVSDDAVIAVDVGNNTYSFGRYFEVNRQTVLMSGYLGSIGFAFPAAMGAWAGAGGRQVVSVSGDGGLGQYLAEFTTAVKYGMNITHVVLNNHELGKISKEQRAGEWPVWQTSLVNPDFAEYATLCGGFGIRVVDGAELTSALHAALDNDGPAMVEVITDSLLI